MELDELKAAWEQYDRKLTRSLKVNEKLLIRVNRNTSRLELQKPLLHEAGNAVAMLVWAILASVFSFRYIAEPKYSVPGFVAGAFGLVCFVIALVKVSALMKIDFYGTSVVRLQREMAHANHLVLSFRKYELVFSLISCITLIPLMFKVVHQTDVYSNPRIFILSVIMLAGLGISYAIWANKNIYDKKFRNSEQLLKEVSEFETDDNV